MGQIKHSRQRDTIMNYLRSTKEHPTADTIYVHVKETLPSISLGTVYRNLNLLTDLGEIAKIPGPDRVDRFDAITAPHNHFYCRNCHRVIDLNLDMDEVYRLNQVAGNSFAGRIDSSETIFFGICGDCI